MTHLRYLRKYFFLYKKMLFVGVVITIVARIFSLVTPQYVEESFDVIEKYLNDTHTDTSQIQTQLLWYILIIVGSSLLSGFFTFMMRQTIINMSRRVEYDLKNEIYNQYQRLDLHFYKQNRIGDLMNRISEDVSKVRMYVGPAIMYSVQTLTLFACVIPLMIYTSATLSFYTLLPLPFLSVLIYVISRKIHKKTLVTQEYLSDLSTFSQETFSGVGVIKAYAIENRIEHMAEKLSKSGRQKNLDLSKTQALFLPMMTLMIGLSMILVMFIGGTLYIDGQISTIGVIAKFAIYVSMLTWPVATVGWVSSIVQQAEASQKRINAFLSVSPEVQNEGFENAEAPVHGDIRFEGVSFTYLDTQIQALKNISFSIKKGERVAILGKTGSGKSTLLDILTRLYDPTQGTIYLDEKPLKKRNLTAVRRSIAMVPQDVFLFSDTIENNIRFGNENATFAQIEQCAKWAEVHHNITHFSKGYNSVLGERGVSLSGGQRQRVAIARALLKKAQIYAFDDSFSAVDTETESKILEHLDQIPGDSTFIFVSHRVVTARYCNRIILLDKGEIVADGSHEQLYAENPIYRSFYDSQQIES